MTEPGEHLAAAPETDSTLPTEPPMRHPYAMLFYTLLLVIGVLPVLRMLDLPDWPVSLVLASALLGATATVAEGRWRRLLIGLIAVIVLVRLLGQFLNWGGGFEEAASAAWVIVAVFVAGGTIRFMFRPTGVRSEQLYAALTAYLLVGLFMGVLYGGIVARSPEAFLVLGEPASTVNFTLGTATYFSFVTLATLGYGDIVPVSDSTRGLAVLEAIGGQLYLAVLVAYFVSAAASPADPRSSREPHDRA